MLVAERIHRVPKAIVEIGAQLVLLRKLFERFTLPHCHLVGDIVDCLGLEYEKPPVDSPAIAAWLLTKAFDAATMNVKCTEAAGRGNGSHCC